jgi:predicted N-acyltransferase
MEAPEDTAGAGLGKHAVLQTWREHPNRPLTTQVRILESLSDVPEAAWDALSEGDPAATPFTRWAFLEALEHTGCAVGDSGWLGRHVTLWEDGRLVAAAPAYLRGDSDGDFSRDWHWAEFASRAGIRYYPKLQVTVPFTPVSGRRLLVAADQDRARRVKELVTVLHEVAKDSGCSSWHVLFPDESEVDELAALGLARRQSFQFHFRNHGYKDYPDFLARGLDSKRRHQARRERGAAAGQGISLRTVRGDEIVADPKRWAGEVHRFHKATVDKLMWGRFWFNLPFYQRIFTRMPGPLEVVAAERDGRLVAGAFNVASKTRLFGRYWGCHEEHPFLHFHVCLYHSIDDAIARGLSVFEGGAGGEHKMSRGFEPSETYSAHAFLEPRLDRALRHHLELEGQSRAAELAQFRAARQHKGPKT